MKNYRIGLDSLGFGNEIERGRGGSNGLEIIGVVVEQSKKMQRKASLIYLGSMIASGTAGAMLWKKHPIGGMFLGGLIVGPVVGTFGMAAAGMPFAGEEV